MNTSPQEREKLRKRLQKLFQKEEILKDFAKGNCSNSRQPKDTTKGSTNLKNSKNKSKQQRQNPKKTNVSSMQNGFAKPSEKHFSENKSKESELKNHKSKVAKLQKKDYSTTTKSNKKESSKKQSQHNNVKISGTQKQSKSKKPISSKMPEKPLKNKGIKSLGKPEDKGNKNHQEENGTQFTSEFRQQNSLSNNYINIKKGQTKKATKRRDLDDTLKESVPSSNKKQKLIKEEGIQKNVKSVNKIQNAFFDESDTSSSNCESEHDVSHMTGCVPSADFDSDYDEGEKEEFYSMQEENCSEYDSEKDNMEYYSWMQKEDYSKSGSEEDNGRQHYKTKTENFERDDSSNETSEENTAMRKFNNTPKSDLKRFFRNEFSDSDEENTDSCSEDEYEDYDSDSFQDEEENYSDYDEDDFEEEEDDHNYTSESECEYLSDYDDFDNDLSYDFQYNDSDDDYKLPKHIPEDLIIHSGTASKRDLKPEDNVVFNSDNEEFQIVELENQETVNIINQPKAYDKQELLKLKFEEKAFNTITFQKKDTMSNHAEECPELVAILDEDGFQHYNSNEELDYEEAFEDEQGYEEQSMEEKEDEMMDNVSLGSDYTEIDSENADSLLSEDINEKYLKRNHASSDSDEDIDEHMWIKKHKADVIDATGYKCEIILQNFSDQTEVSLNDDINQIPSVNLYKNVDLKTDSNILSTTIIDNNIHFSNENYDQKLSAKFIEAQDTEDTSTTLDDESIDKENNKDESPKVAKPYIQSIVNYNTKFFNAFNSNSVMVLLKDPFYIYGTVRLTLLAGSMEIYGHTLKLNREVEIFSPRGCSVIEISSLRTEKNKSKDDLKETLKPYENHFSLNDLKTITKLYNGETDAVVLLKRNEARKKVVQQFKKFMNENVFPNINNINADRPLYNSEYILRCMINTSSQGQKCLCLPKDWQQFRLTTKTRIMLAGGKSVGKSTLLRYLINRHLPQKVLLIDLDIGQPEVFIPQTVSCTIIDQPLLGPGFMLNLQPEISFTVGHTNIALCAHKYLSAVHSLFAYCKEKEDFKEIPWLINTMGYNKGFGLELISVLAQESLTDVIQLQSSKEINNFESTLHGHVLSSVPHILFSEEYEHNKKEIKENWNYKLHIWPSAVQQESRYQKEWEMSAKDLRYAMLLARLSAALHGHADWLTDVKPLNASLSDLKIINLMDNTPLVSPEELEKVIEANLVYLCHYEEDSKPLKCFGIGVVRAVDFHVRQLYLIPALPNAQLKDVNCLAIGEMPLPTSLFTNQGSRVKNIAPFVYNTIAANASKAIKQIYHRPAKFLTGKQKSLD